MNVCGPNATAQRTLITEDVNVTHAIDEQKPSYPDIRYSTTPLLSIYLSTIIGTIPTGLNHDTRVHKSKKKKLQPDGKDTLGEMKMIYSEMERTKYKLLF